MGLWSLWLIIATVFLVIEFFSQSIWALCVALGAFAAMGAALGDLTITWQTILLIGVCILAYLILLPWLRKLYMKGAKPIATGMDALIGRHAILTENIRPGMLGRVKIDGDNWQARSENDVEEIEAGTKVTVTGYESIILTVRRHQINK